MQVFKAVDMNIKEIDQIFCRYGYKHQANKTIEELLELITELVKVKYDRENLELIVGELADVIIMCTQLTLYIGPVMVNDEINFKIDRQLARMEAENSNTCANCNKFEPSDPNTVCHPCEWEPMS